MSDQDPVNKALDLVSTSGSGLTATLPVVGLEPGSGSGVEPLSALPGHNVYGIKASHVAERLRLKDLRGKFSQPEFDFSNYLMTVRYSSDSFLFVFNYGSVVFFNVPEAVQRSELAVIQQIVVGSEHLRTSDQFLLEVAPSTNATDAQNGGLNRVFFDRVRVSELSDPIVKIVCMLLAESTALDYYENLIENLLVKTNAFAKTLRRQGKMLESTKDLIKFIGLCLDTKQEIIANLYIVDSPDETWESIELDKMHQELKSMMEIEVRYRALEYKIQIIQEGVEIIVDLSKTKRETLLELTIILLIAFEIIISIIKWT